MKKFIFAVIFSLSLSLLSGYENFSNISVKEQYEKGMDAYGTGDFESMRIAVENAEKIIKDAGLDNSEDGNMVSVLSGIYESAKFRYSNAYDYLKKGYEYFTSKNDSQGVAASGIYYGEACMRTARHNNAIEALKKSYAFYKMPENYKNADYRISAILYNISLSYYSTKNYDEAIKAGEELTALDQKIYGSSSEEYKIDMLYLASSYYETGKYMESVESFAQVSSFLDTTKAISTLQTVLMFRQFGMAYYNEESYFYAQYYLGKSIEKYKSAGVNAKNNLPSIYIEYGDALSEYESFDAAREAYQNAYNSAVELYGDESDSARDAENRLLSLKKKKKNSSDVNGLSCLKMNRVAAIKLSVELLQSLGKQYYGGGAGISSRGLGLSAYYYYSFPKENGTAGRYMPVYLSASLGRGLAIAYGFDLMSILTKSSINAVSGESPYAREIMLTFSAIPYVPLSLRYIWSSGGYLPQGLSLSAGVRYYF